jgi:glycerol-3-phosphate acyltransferase PlsY
VGYLIGSIPTGYLMVKWYKGGDLRKYGSGTISASMVWEHVSKWAAIFVGLFDIFKAFLATWLGLRLGGGVTVAILAGMAAVIGHNWPVYLNFVGGRGLSPFLGILLVIYPWGGLYGIILIEIGYLFGDSAPWALGILFTLPVLALLTGGGEGIILAVGIMAVVTFLKRLQANGRPLPEDAKERRKMILLRLFFDRDIPSHKDWIRRKQE